MFNKSSIGLIMLMEKAKPVPQNPVRCLAVFSWQCLLTQLIVGLNKAAKFDGNLNSSTAVVKEPQKII